MKYYITELVRQYLIRLLLVLNCSDFISNIMIFRIVNDIASKKHIIDVYFQEIHYLATTYATNKFIRQNQKTSLCKKALSENHYCDEILFLSWHGI